MSARLRCGVKPQQLTNDLMTVSDKFQFHWDITVKFNLCMEKVESKRHSLTATGKSGEQLTLCFGGLCYCCMSDTSAYFRSLLLISVFYQYNIAYHNIMMCWEFQRENHVVSGWNCTMNRVSFEWFDCIKTDLLVACEWHSCCWVMRCRSADWQLLDIVNNDLW